MAKPFTKFILFVLTISITVQFFQNCSAITPPNDGDTSSRTATNATTPENHPNDSLLNPNSQKPMLANRIYISELLSEIFESPETKGATFGLIRAWVYDQSGIFGYPCNPKGALGLADCGGNILASMNPATDTLRASHKSQICLTLTGNNTFLQNALNKIDNRPATPDQASLDQLAKLFYRGDEDLSGLTTSLINVDQNLKQEDPNISDLDRWRFLTNLLCESPNWELL